MASAPEKMEALAFWVATSILVVTMALLGTPIWATVIGILNSMSITGANNISNLHAVQPIPMIYYGFLVCFEIAVIIRTVFVVWSKSTYENTF
jgi:hypothetical protein